MTAGDVRGKGGPHGTENIANDDVVDTRKLSDLLLESLVRRRVAAHVPDEDDDLYICMFSVGRKGSGEKTTHLIPFFSVDDRLSVLLGERHRLFDEDSRTSISRLDCLRGLPELKGRW